MKTVKTAFHEHLGTGLYRGDFDRVIDLARARLGPGGMFSVVSTGDDRCNSDRRYETFVDLRSKKYGKVDLGGRGVYVEGADVVVWSGTEYEVKEGHLLAIGLERDTEIGPDVAPFSNTWVVDMSKLPIEKVIREVEKRGGMSFIVHPFFIDGAGDWMHEKLVDQRVPFWLYGFEIVNGEAYLPFPGHCGANAKALQFFRDNESDLDGIAPVCWADGHSLREFARITTSIPKPVSMDGGDFTESNKLITDVRTAFGYLTLEAVLKNDMPGLGGKIRGAVGGLQHGLDLKFVHPRRLRREAKS